VDVAGLDKLARLKDEMQSPLFVLLAISGRIAAIWILRALSRTGHSFSHRQRFHSASRFFSRRMECLSRHNVTGFYGGSSAAEI
jgi:hypothetical protein